MLPLRMLGLLMLCLPLCDAGNTCPPSLNPLTVVDPPVVEFGDYVNVNCSTEEEFEEITLMLGNELTKNEEFDNVASSFTRMTDWDMKSECKIKLNNSFECSKELDIILYQIPEVHLFITETKTLGEETNYKLQCDVCDVAPAQNLTVRWFKSDEILDVQVYSETTKTPVNISSMLVVNVTRDENAVEVRCEAQLELGPHGPQHPVVSQTLNLSALYAPEFRTNQSRHIIVNEGEDVSLTCEADGIPPPKYQWTINGIESLETSDTLKMIKVNKSATYSCTASNKHGNVTLNVYVDVPEVTTTAAPAAMASPQALTPQEIPEVLFSIKSTDVQGIVSHYLLQCVVVSATPAENILVKWYKNDVIIKSVNEPARTHVNTSSMLVVNVTRDENAVEVRCEAQLELGPHGPQHPVVSQTLNLSALYAPEFRTNQSRHIIVIEGEDVNLTCEADGIPPPKYQWTINGIDALETSDTLKMIKVNKSATYSCTASNKHGNVTLNVSVDVPEVTTTAAPAAMASPQALTPQEIPEVLFSIKSTDVQGIVSHYLLQCVVVSATPAENILVKWYKNDVIIKSVNEPARTHVNTSSMLVVNVTRDENAVEVRCEAQLELGPHGPQHPVVSQTLNLSALYAPEFRTNQSRHIIVNEGEDVNLTCEADGIPPPKYQWTINGIDALETSDTLKMIKVNKSATYSCTASNKHGNVTLNVSVDVPEVTTTAAPAAMASPQALTPQGCSLTVTPPEVVVKFGDPVVINCSTAATTTFRMGWEYSAGKATVNNSYAIWKIDKLEDWTLQPICYVYPDIGSPCIETASIILYQTPDLVSVSALDDGPMEAGSTYRLKCDIYNVAPAHNLSVKWYRDNTTLYTDHITTYDVTPRNVTSSLTITPLRRDHRSIFRCEAELHLGPRGPERHPTAASAPFVATVLYAPEFKEGNISKELTPDRDVTFDCSAEGNPDPEIKWIYKPAHNLKETTEGRQKIITVTAATSTNAGFYICVATNQVGNVTRTVTLVMRGKTSSVFVYWLPILLLVIIILVGLYCLCHRRKKKGEYSFVSDSDKSSIPMTGSAAGTSKEGNQNNL